MSEEKLSSHEVPKRFAEWLLAMGCSPEQVPSVDKIAEMCRGQYYMVWRSLMEKIDAKDVIRNKRLRVFCDDIRKCQRNNVFSERDSKTLVPEELALWKEQSELRKSVEEAEARVALARKDLNQLMDRNNICQRELSRGAVKDAARRVQFLRQLSADLQQKISDLKETRSIATSLCSLSKDDMFSEESDLQNKLDKCISIFRRKHSQATPALCNSNTSVMSANGDIDLEEQVLSVVRGGGGGAGGGGGGGGEAVCSNLLERRAALLPALITPPTDGTKQPHTRSSPQSVLAHTAALHCTLSLEAVKNKMHLEQARKKLVSTVTELNNQLSGESCELLVLRSENAHIEARVDALRGLLDELRANTGTFHVDKGDPTPPGSSVAAVDKAIESKKEEVKRTIAMLSSTERRIQSIRECLAAVLGAFRPDSAPPALAHYRGMQVELPSESIAELREFYASCRRRTADLSFDMDNTDDSLTDNIDLTNPRFVDELRIYLKKFNLEKNRQLVLENGEKIHIFETVQSSIERLLQQWLQEEISCTMLSPVYNLDNNIRRLVENVQMKNVLENMVKSLKCGDSVKEIDIKPQMQEEEELTDQVKKHLRDNLVDLQKVAKTFASSQEDLRLWSENNARRYVSSSRTIEGMTYRDYEKHYLEK